MLGPLTNPAGADAQVLGVYSPELTELHAGVLKNLGSERAYVVHGAGGLDEISTLGPSRITELRDGELSTYEFTPEEVGLPRAASPKDLEGGTAEENAKLLVSILEKGTTGPARDIVVLNAAAAIAAGGLCDDLGEGVSLAAEAIESGAAMERLQKLQAF
jgi:anthranilate phosphoribosyltransferase